MIFNLFRKPPAADAAFACYRSIVAQSRQERFYADWGIPDTVTGRFNMIAVHLALLLRRLKGEPSARALTQTLVNLFFLDMDRSHRELGVTDLGVPRQIKKLGKVFYGIVESIDGALSDPDPGALEQALVRNIYMNAPAPRASELAAYILAKAAVLDAWPTANLLAGRLEAEAAA
jgi:cytochrome b pre-mRNA-processing protein 3